MFVVVSADSRVTTLFCLWCVFVFSSFFAKHPLDQKVLVCGLRVVNNGDVMQKNPKIKIKKMNDPEFGGSFFSCFFMCFFCIRPVQFHIHIPREYGANIPSNHH